MSFMYLYLLFLHTLEGQAHQAERGPRLFYSYKLPCTIEVSHPVINQIPIGTCPQMEYPVDRVSHTVVGLAKKQFVMMFFRVLGNHRYDHASLILVSSSPTFSIGKPEQREEYAMTANLCQLNKIMYIETIRSIGKLHRRIASFL